MALQDLEQHLRSLSPDEQASAIYILVQSLGNPWRSIEKTPGVCGGRACIANTRIPIWGLVEAKRSGYSDADLLASYPTLTANDLANAWIYVAAHPEEIEVAIHDNQAV
ncbi:MAG: hypothetical protein DCF21_14190 [Leptolyngbya sp.]|nr:MAG: hypothetical protein DCF21_14190 [Leptolyngbya sp.]